MKSQWFFSPSLLNVLGRMPDVLMRIDTIYDFSPMASSNWKSSIRDFHAWGVSHWEYKYNIQPYIVKHVLPLWNSYVANNSFINKSLPFVFALEGPDVHVRMYFEWDDLWLYFWRGPRGSWDYRFIEHHGGQKYNFSTPLPPITEVMKPVERKPKPKPHRNGKAYSISEVALQNQYKSWRR